MIYYLYHIPGKKIGVTRDLDSRVTVAQGYKPGEYEVLDSSEDISYISNKEIELQKSYGYKVDRQTYRDLMNKKSNKMKLNVTEQTTTFPVPLVDLKKYLKKELNVGYSWETDLGEFKLDSKENINWIAHNAITSMYDKDRCFIYNKAYYEAFIGELSGNHEGLVNDVERSVYDLIRLWAAEKGIYAKGDSKTQYIKLLEETGELAKALLNNDKPEIIDAIGDIVVVLTNLAKLEDLKIEDCVQSAYDVIKSRKGKMINGTFVKQTL
jgi:NTP pyrophosphatase (non-canonical NTP hydrolase)